MTSGILHRSDLALTTSSAAPRFGLRDRRDLRTLIWAFGLFPLPALVALLRPEFWPYVLPFALYLGFCAGVLAHYHNHRAIFRSRTSNALYSNWLGIFYGFPLFGWIPTHNRNHHKFVNGEGDATRTAKMGEDTLLAALLYPLLSSRWQLPALREFIASERRKRGYRSIEPLVQLGTLFITHTSIAALCLVHSGWEGGGAYIALVFGPAAFSSWSMMFTNYLQHVGCDPSSPNNHSRNFVGSWENWLVFDAGLHTVHHEHPGVHFAEYRRLHAARAATIDPDLNERNILTFLLRRYGPQ